MAPGFVITKFNDEAVKSAEDFQKKFSDASGAVAFEGIYEGFGESSYFYGFNKE